MDYVAEFLRRGMPLLQARAEQLRRDHPGVEVNIWEEPERSPTPAHGYDVGIECLLENELPDGTERLVLMIELARLDREPRLDYAGVKGNGMGHDADLVFIDRPTVFTDEDFSVPLTEASFETLVTDWVPKLLEALTRGLARVRSTDA
jgi:hypothetical protein